MVARPPQLTRPCLHRTLEAYSHLQVSLVAGLRCAPLPPVHHHDADFLGLQAVANDIKAHGLWANFTRQLGRGGTREGVGIVMNFINPKL